MPAATVSNLRTADRVLIYGVTGSGKSSAAERFGLALGLPVHLVDEEIGWLPGWSMREQREQRDLAAQRAACARWVLDTAYGSWREVVLPRTQVIVALDYPRWLSLTRLLRRTGRRWRTQELICNGNTETLRKIVSSDSILVWHFRSFSRKRYLMRRWEQERHGPAVLRVTRPRDLERILGEL